MSQNVYHSGHQIVTSEGGHDIGALSHRFDVQQKLLRYPDADLGRVIASRNDTLLNCIRNVNTGHLVMQERGVPRAKQWQNPGQHGQRQRTKALCVSLQKPFEHARIEDRLSQAKSAPASIFLRSRLISRSRSSALTFSAQPT